MSEHEIVITRLFNDHLAGLGNWFLSLVRQPPQGRPWVNFVTMEILVALIIIVLFAILRTALSMDRPGKLQHTFEIIHDFLCVQAQETGIHRYQLYVPFFGTLFIFILFSNLIGIVPGFESPTMFPSVPAGCAMAAFLFYNVQGFRELKLGYLKQFAGPMPVLAPLMIPIEIVSHLARPLSLTIRLFANMYAGEQVTLAFLGLVPLLVPVAFMGLHVFVSFLQAYVFTLLTMIYVQGAIAHEH